MLSIDDEQLVTISPAMPGGGFGRALEGTRDNAR
jgi:hypothetical protein